MSRVPASVAPMLAAPLALALPPLLPPLLPLALLLSAPPPCSDSDPPPSWATLPVPRTFPRPLEPPPLPGSPAAPRLTEALAAVVRLLPPTPPWCLGAPRRGRAPPPPAAGEHSTFTRRPAEGSTFTWPPAPHSTFTRTPVGARPPPSHLDAAPRARFVPRSTFTLEPTLAPAAALGATPLPPRARLPLPRRREAAA